MKTQVIGSKSLKGMKLMTLVIGLLLIAACASSPTAPDGAAEARAKLTLLRTNTELASRAPIEIQAAETAVAAAEQPQREYEVGRHLVLIADQKVDIAAAWAQSRLYEDQRAALSARSETMRLDARTREADRARIDAANARIQASDARSDSDFARRQAEAARNAASDAQYAATAARNQAATDRTAADIARDQAAMAQADANAARSATAVARDQAAGARLDANTARTDAEAARAETAELQRQISELNARETERGLVVTLGDVLFETGQSALRGGTPNNLNRLALFLNRFDTRTVVIEGHTDSVGTAASNLALSQRRADSVRTYLVNQGVSGSRIMASGQGQTLPIADNSTDTGRQQNRRVEVIISNPDN